MRKLSKQQVFLLFAVAALIVLIIMIGWANLSGNQFITQIGGTLAVVLGLFLTLVQTILPIIDQLRSRQKITNESIVDALSELETASAYLDDKKYVQAINKATDVIKILPKKAKAYQIRARAYQAMGQLAQALNDYDKAIELEPGHPFNYSGRASLLRDLGEYQAAIPDFHKALAISPELRGTFFQLAQCYFNIGKFETAIKYYKKVLELAEPRDQEKSFAQESIIRAENMLKLQQDGIPDLDE